MGEPQPLLTVDQVCGILGISRSTLYHWRTIGIGPSAVKLPNGIRFRPGTVHDWILGSDTLPILRP